VAIEAVSAPLSWGRTPAIEPPLRGRPDPLIAGIFTGSFVPGRRLLLGVSGVQVPGEPQLAGKAILPAPDRTAVITTAGAFEFSRSGEVSQRSDAIDLAIVPKALGAHRRSGKDRLSDGPICVPKLSPGSDPPTFRLPGGPVFVGDRGPLPVPARGALWLHPKGTRALPVPAILFAPPEGLTGHHLSRTSCI
jgi:hypothetical protein